MRILVIGSRRARTCPGMEARPGRTHGLRNSGKPRHRTDRQHRRSRRQTISPLARRAFAPTLPSWDPEAPLVAGVVDAFPHRRALAIVGPTAGQCRATRSQQDLLAKQVHARSRHPHCTALESTSTPRTRPLSPPSTRFTAPGGPQSRRPHAAGKGVVIAHHTRRRSPNSAIAALGPRIWSSKNSCTGEEVSFIVLSDGTRRAVASRGHAGPQDRFRR